MVTKICQQNGKKPTHNFHRDHSPFLIMHIQFYFLIVLDFHPTVEVPLKKNYFFK